VTIICADKTLKKIGDIKQTVASLLFTLLESGTFFRISYRISLLLFVVLVSVIVLRVAAALCKHAASMHNISTQRLCCSEQ
jgi:hypothetical protein